VLYTDVIARCANKLYLIPQQESLGSASCLHPCMENTAPDEITPVGKSSHLFRQHGLDQNHQAAGFSPSTSEQGGNDDLYDSSIQVINQDSSSIALGTFQVHMNLQPKEMQLETAWAAQKRDRKMTFC